MASLTRGGVRANTAGSKASARQSNTLISVWANTQHNAVAATVTAGKAKDGSEDKIEIAYEPEQVASDYDVRTVIFHGTFAEFVAKLQS